MSSNNTAAVSAFIEGAPPGELADVVTDIKALTVEDPKLLEQARPAFRKYNEEQLTTVKLPGSSKNVLISQFNSQGDRRYYDIESQSSFAFDNMTQKVSDVQPYAPETQHLDLITSLHKPFSLHAREHYPTSTIAIYPHSDPQSLTLLLVSNKYSPTNFWNGRLRTIYTYTPSSSTLTGILKCDVHYYEDGNVRLTTSKQVPETSVSEGGAGSVVREIAKIEKRWQEELNRGFNQLSEESFKGLRRQLPVTRQKVEWEKVGGLRVGREIGGARR